MATTKAKKPLEDTTEALEDTPVVAEAVEPVEPVEGVVEATEEPVAVEAIEEEVVEEISEPVAQEIAQPTKVPFVGDQRTWHGAQYGQSMTARRI